MRIEQIHHVLDEVRRIAAGRKLLVVGSQSAYASLGPNDGATLPSRMLYSMEVDIVVSDDEKMMDAIEDAIGAHSPFHEEHGYFADCVELDLAVLPDGWEERLIPFYISECSALEIYDCACAKLYAAREKDEFFIIEAMKIGLLDYEALQARLSGMPVPSGELAKMRADLIRLHEEASENPNFAENEDQSVVFLFDPRK